MSHITSHSQRFQRLLWCHTDFLRLAVAHISGKADRTDLTDNEVRRKREDVVTQIALISQIIFSQKYDAGRTMDDKI